MTRDVSSNGGGIDAELLAYAVDEQRRKFAALHGRHGVPHTETIMAAFAASLVEFEGEILFRRVTPERPNQGIALHPRLHFGIDTRTNTCFYPVSVSGRAGYWGSTAARSSSRGITRRCWLGAGYTRGWRGCGSRRGQSRWSSGRRSEYL